MKAQPPYGEDVRAEIVKGVRAIRSRRPEATWRQIRKELTEKHKLVAYRDYNQPRLVTNVPSINTLRDWLLLDEKRQLKGRPRSKLKPHGRAIFGELAILIKSYHDHPYNLGTSREIQERLQEKFGIKRSHSSINDARRRALTEREDQFLDQLAQVPEIKEVRDRDRIGIEWTAGVEDSRGRVIGSMQTIESGFARAICLYFERHPGRLPGANAPRTWQDKQGAVRDWTW